MELLRREPIGMEFIIKGCVMDDAGLKEPENFFGKGEIATKRPYFPEVAESFGYGVGGPCGKFRDGQEFIWD